MSDPFQFDFHWCSLSSMTGLSCSYRARQNSTSNGSLDNPTAASSNQKGTVRGMLRRLSSMRVAKPKDQPSGIRRLLLVLLLVHGPPTQLIYLEYIRSTRVHVYGCRMDQMVPSCWVFSFSYVLWVCTKAVCDLSLHLASCSQCAAYKGTHTADVWAARSHASSP